MAKVNNTVSRASLAAALTLGAWGAAGAAPALAQDGAGGDEIVVTGSYIRGTPENAALPVDVVSAQEIQRQGTPSMVDLIKSIPSSTGVFGDSNQYTAGQTTGTGNVNLRGLGAFRTLVLLNGRRVVSGPGAGVGVDTNLFPTAAIGRIEVLKDGAAATYGSDAIGGVVNFITRTDLEGFEAIGNYSLISGSDGDMDIALNWGHRFDRGDILVSVGHRERNELDALERDWATRPFSAFDPAAIGGWSVFGNPGVFTTSTTGSTSAGTPILDPACGTMGTVFASGCRFQFVAFNNIVENEDHDQIYAQLNYEILDGVDMHLEALWARHDVPDENSSPSYGPVQGPGTLANGGGIGGGVFFVPGSCDGSASVINPGFAGLCEDLSGGQQTAINTAGGLYMGTVSWRPLAVNGNPLFGGSKNDQRNFDGYRLSGSLSGDFGETGGWDVALTYSVNESDIATPDIIVSRLGYALRGLGGPSCDTDLVTPGVQGTPGSANCLFFNPFSSAITQNPALGLPNTTTSPGNLAPNSTALIDWLFEDYAYQVRTEQVVLDAVLNGQTGIELGGGPLAWAAGVQYREQTTERTVNDFSNIAINPCVNLGDTTCTQRNGSFSFFGPLSNFDLTGDNYAVFGELNVPLLEGLEAQIAVRFEDYGGAVGDTTNPKVSLRWQPVEMLALRASAGTTFRAPPQTQLDPNATRTLAFTAASGGYRAYDVFGEPDLQPETATTYNVGAIFEAGPFQATVDYWSFEFQDPITTESGTRMVAALYNTSIIPGGCASTPAAFLARFTFNGACDSGIAAARGLNLTQTEVHTINGPDITMRGIDLSASLSVSDLFGGDIMGGELTIGVDATHILEWSSDTLLVEGVPVRAAADYAGAYDHLGFDATPEWKGSAYVQFNEGPVNVRWTTRYVSELIDLRAINAAHETKVIDAYTQHDVSMVFNVTDTSTLSASLINVFDEEPPFAGTDLGYVPSVGSPLGRVFRVGFRQRF